MRNYMRTVAVALSAAFILAAGVSIASATHLRVSERNIRVVWTPLTFKGVSGAPNIRCNVTLEGTFHESTITKSIGTLIGNITRVGVTRPCAGGTAWAYNGVEANEVLGGGRLANTLPWHLTYEGFEGTLPNITGVRILLGGARFLVRASVLGFVVLCNYTTGATNGFAAGTAQVERGTITGLLVDNTRQIRSETGGCPEGVFEGTGVVTVLNSTNRVIVTLI